ncbi:hypothetical protein TNCV_1894921 [Trichonephila clavipes]|nr:hypothetical protein TNCV_1894921 [Trichonephila clavipes]
MISILVETANSFKPEIADSADILIGSRRECHFCSENVLYIKRKFGKKKLSLQEALDILQNLSSEISDVLTDEFLYEVTANNLLGFSLDSKDDDQEIEQASMSNS